MSAKINLNIPKNVKNSQVLSNLGQELRVATQIRDSVKLLCVVRGICRIMDALEVEEMRDEATGLSITVNAIQGGSTLETKEYNGTDYSCKIE